MDLTQHSIMLLEDCGMVSRYPRITLAKASENGEFKDQLFFDLKKGRRVNLEKNQTMKFIMMFFLLDLLIDTNNPELIGKSYRAKYKSLPEKEDIELILRQIFRFSKLVRNALIHNPSSVKTLKKEYEIKYSNRGQEYKLKITKLAWSYLCTAITMFTKGNLGKGAYFSGIMRSVYTEITGGITEYSDEFGGITQQELKGCMLNVNARKIFITPHFEVAEDKIQFKVPLTNIPPGESADFYITLKDTELLVPLEVLDSELAIEEKELLANWKREGSFPKIS